MLVQLILMKQQDPFSLQITQHKLKKYMLYDFVF